MKYVLLYSLYSIVCTFLVNVLDAFLGYPITRAGERLRDFFFRKK